MTTLPHTAKTSGCIGTKLCSETVDVEAVEKDAFKGLIKGKSIITVDGEKRWSKKKQFRAEIKEVFGGKDRCRRRRREDKSCFEHENGSLL